MYNKSGIVTDQSTAQVPVAGASVFVLDGNRALVPLFDAAGNSLLNPLTTDTFGAYSYYSQSAGQFIHEYWWGARRRYIEQNVVGPLIAAVNPSPENAGKYLAYDAAGNPIGSVGTGADAGLRTDLAAPTGASLSGAADGNSVQANLDHGGWFEQSGDGAVKRKAQDRLRDTVNVLDFYDADNDPDHTAAFNRAYAYLDSLGGGRITGPAITYTVATQTGTMDIPAHDDGTCALPSGTAPIAAETVYQMPYYVLAKPNVVMALDHGAVIQGAYTYGDADLTQPIGFAYASAGTARENLTNIGFEGVTFTGFFFAIAAMNHNIATSRFTHLQFNSCAICIYALSLEQCHFEHLTFLSSGCGIAVGGQWRTRVDNYNEDGGFADKNTFLNIRNNMASRNYGTGDAAIDTFFDTYFYKKANKAARAGAPVQAASVIHNGYYGLCGRAIMIMARYSRPSNSNQFLSISHANAYRGAVRIENANACKLTVGYVEQCGWLNPTTQAGGIGSDGNTDPCLGAGVRIPAMFEGINAVDHLEIQTSYVAQGSDAAFYLSEHLVSSDLTTALTAPRIPALTTPGAVSALSLAASSTTAPTNIGAYFGMRSFGIGTAGYDTKIPVNAGSGGMAMLLVVSKHTGTGTNTNSNVSLLNFPFDGGTAPVITSIAGTAGLYTASVSSGGTLILTSASGNLVAYAIATKPLASG